MTQGSGHVIDPAGEARRVLEAAVAERGPAVLSDPATMDGICRARLHGMPGETILIGSAARSDVPALLRQQVGRLGLEGAISSAAATVASAHHLDTGACEWVVREYARALGYPVPGSPGIPAAPPPPPQAPPSAYAPTQAAIYPPTPPYQQAPPPYQPYQPYQQPPPPVYPQAGAPGGGTLPQGRPPSGPGRISRSALGVVAAVALVVVYLGVAAAAHLAPFGKTAAVVTATPVPTPRPHPSPTFSAPSPSVSPDQAATTSTDQALWNLIPAAVQTSDCQATAPTDQATEEIYCTDAVYSTGTPGAYLYYYLFANSSTLDASYANNFLNPLDISTGEGNCGSFSSFMATCETGWNNTNPAISGRITEYLYKGYDTLTWTEEQQDVMVYMSGVNGDEMLNWWLYPDRWIVTGG